MTPRFRRTTLFITVLSLLPLSALRADDDAANDAKIDTARQQLKALTGGKHQAFIDASTRQMRDALTPEKIDMIWKGLIEAHGPYQGETAASVTRKQDFAIVVFSCAFERTNLEITITIDGNDKVAGLFFRPIESTVPYSSPPYVDPAKFEETPMTIVADRRFPLPGTLALPKGTGPFPGVVLVHGSGPNDRDETIGGSKPFKDIAQGLASRGIAVLRYDKRTLKYADGLDAKELTIDGEAVDDAIAAAQLLMAQHGVDRRAVFVLGHSLGATAAPRIPSKNKNIAGIIMMAAAARPLHDLVEDQLSYIAAIDGKMTEAEENQLAGIRQTIKRIRDKTWTANDRLLETPVSYWAGLEMMKPVETAKRLRCPILVLHGGRDYQVTEKDFAIWQRELADHTNVTIKHFAAMDHLFRRGVGPSTPQDYQEPGHVDADVVDYVATWVTDRAAQKQSRD